MARVDLSEFKNPFLTQAMRAIRKDRPVYGPKVTSEVDRRWQEGGDFAMIWFPSNGCTWDGCTMCNYSKGSGIVGQHMVTAVQRALDSLDLTTLGSIEVGPAGSILDPVEVPIEAQNQIFRLMKETKVPLLVIESRAETITDEDLLRVREHLGHEQKLLIMLGLESANPWIQNYIVNKASHPSRFVTALKTCHEHGVGVSANISLGHAFMSPRESIDDAYHSALWALEQGVDSASLFPLLIKAHTLLDFMHRHGRYESPSLWSLVEVLSLLGEERVKKVSIAWYKQWFQDPFIKAPITCEKCTDDVITHLDEFYATQSYAVIEKLSNYSCDCRKRWRESLDVPTQPLPQRVIQAYDWLASELRLERFWKKRREDVIREINEGFRGYKIL